MFCSNCGANIPDGTRFCTNCGAQIEAQPQPQPQAQPQPQQYEPQPQNMKPGMSTGKILAIIFGVLALMAVIVIVAFVLLFKAVSKEDTKSVVDITEETYAENKSGSDTIADSATEAENTAEEEVTEEPADTAETASDNIWADITLDKDGGLGNLSWKIPSAWDGKLRDKRSEWTDKYKILSYDPVDDQEIGFYIVRQKFLESADEYSEDEIFDAVAEVFFGDSEVTSEVPVTVNGLPCRIYHANVVYDGDDRTFDNLCYVVLTPDDCYYAFGCSEENQVDEGLTGFMADFIETVSYGTWFEKAGLTMNPQGDFTYHTMANDKVKDTEKIEVPGSVTIKESTDGVDEGYKTVTATFKYDISEVKKHGGDEFTWLSVFDRYTGIAFELDDACIAAQADQPDLKEGFFRINDRDDQYDIKVDFEFSDKSNMKVTNTVIVTCPVTYDGAVFQIGYSDLEFVDKYNSMDFTTAHTMDEFVDYDKSDREYLYFNEDDK